MLKIRYIITLCALTFAVASFAQAVQNTPNTTNDEQHFAKYLSTADFRANIFDYKSKKEWQYNGVKPCFIDFYATWCGPCKALAPTVEALAKEYDGKIDVYKVDVDKERELAAVFGVRSIPTLLFIPMADQPQVIQGAYPKDALVELIDVLLLGQKPKNMKMWQANEQEEQYTREKRNE